MPLIEQVDAIQFLQPHLFGIHGIVSGGWNDYMSCYPDVHRLIHSSITRASIVHDHIIDRASRYLQTQPGVRLHEVKGLKALVIDDQYAIRFKKLDESGISRNQPTKQVQDFREQIPLPGIHTVYNLEAGYVLDKLETGIAKICITCPNGGRNYWEYEIQDTGATVSAIRDLFNERPSADELNEPALIVTKHIGHVAPLRRDKDED